MNFFRIKFYVKTLIIMSLSFHFSSVILVQFFDLGYTKSRFVNKIKVNYIIPFFEQNWGMFSPNPPRGNQYFIIKFRANNSTALVDIHEKIKENSDRGLFNLDQRLLKYQIECYNDIIDKFSENKLKVNSPHVENSHGLESILNYSKFSLKNQYSFLEKLKPNDSIYADIYLMDMPLNPYNSKEKFGETKYMLFSNIYLLKKANLYE
ncbi:DUF5819 family protein [Elizabethkingia anophelis]|uniref:DUF5819 family protein n=1 Tax=Elizabethkingia anophelis TaxID=1117645 RepID=UPI00355680B0